MLLMRRVAALAAVLAIGVALPACAQPVTQGAQTTLILRRFDGGFGTVRVSNGIPLPPGYLTMSMLSQLHVIMEGREVPIAVAPLAGRHPDGSLRAVLLQFNATLSSAPVSATLLIGGTRTLNDTLTPPSMLPVAAALPTMPAFLVASRWGGALTPSGAPAPTMLAVQYEADYARLEAADWKRCEAKWSCGRTAGYDRAFTTYQAWLRTGDPTFWYHATAEAADYVRSYIAPSPSPTPWWAQPEGLAIAYWATGSDSTRYQLRKAAEMLAWLARPTTAYALGEKLGDDRFRAKVLLAALAARSVGMDAQPSDAPSWYNNQGAPPKFYANSLTPATLPALVDAVLGTQQPNGMFGGTQYGGGQSNYMAGMLVTALTRYYDEVKPDPRIPVAVRRWIDDAWMNEWNADKQGFQYNSLRGTTAAPKCCASSGVNAPNYLPGLNGLIAAPFAWYAALTNDANYQRKVDQILAGLAIPASRDWWAQSGKAFDEAFYRTFNVIAWRSGVR